MSETKWTPGPWEYRAPVDLPGLETPAHVVKVTVTPADRRTQFVATCNAVSLPNADNARLIAAAPDLYEALEAIQWGNVVWDEEGGGQGTEYRLCPECDQSKVRGHAPDCRVGTALDKARGEL